jgi:hypothetical protein
MRNLISTIVGRQAAGMAITGGLLLASAALGFIALGCLAFALYFHFMPTQGRVAAAGITAGIYLAAAAVLALIARYRFGGSHQQEAPAAPSDNGALAVGLLLRDELGKHAVPATIVALMGGLVAGLAPDATRNVTRELLDALTRKPDRPL